VRQGVRFRGGNLACRRQGLERRSLFAISAHSPMASSHRALLWLLAALFGRCAGQSAQASATASATAKASANILCAPGSYSVSGSGYQPCTSCAIGMYAAATGATSCSFCGAGTTSLTPGASSCLQFGIAYVLDYGGNYSFFTVPATVTTLAVHLWGGGGGGNGGAGAFLLGTLDVTPGETLRLIVGCGSCSPGLDMQGGGGQGWSKPYYIPPNVHGGGRSSIQRCLSSFCAPYSPTALGGPSWQEIVTAGGGGAGLHPGAYASWDGVTAVRGNDFANSSSPSVPGNNCNGGGATMTTPGSPFGAQFVGASGYAGGGGGWFGGGTSVFDWCWDVYGLSGGSGSSNPTGLNNVVGRSASPSAPTVSPGGDISPYYSASIGYGGSNCAGGPGRIVVVSVCSNCTCSAGFSGISVCTYCDRGTYSEVGGPSCTLCPAGTFSTAIRATSPSTCTSCPAGTYSLAGSSTCTQCSPGTASSAVGAGSSSTCSSCPVGSYSSSFGSALCSLCPAGSYANSTGTPVRCTACPTGTFSPNHGATTAFTCVPCQAGSWSLSPGASSCPQTGIVFDYVGNFSFYTVPATVSAIVVHVWGGGGGGSGGAGAFLLGTLDVRPGETLRLIVGCGSCSPGLDMQGGGGQGHDHGHSYSDVAQPHGGGRSSIQRCLSSFCAPYSPTALGGPSWQEIVTAGGGGGGAHQRVAYSYPGAYASWDGVTAVRGNDFANSSSPGHPNENEPCNGGGATMTTPGSPFGAQFVGASWGVGGGGG